MRNSQKPVALAVFVGVFTVFLVMAAPAAQACDCASDTDLRYLERSDAVFAGRLVRIDRPTQAVYSPSNPNLVHFEVDRVFKGTVRRSQAVITETSGASCGLEVIEGEQVLVFANSRGGSHVKPGPGELYAGLCGGTRVEPAGTVLPGFPAPTPPLEQATAPGSSALPIVEATAMSSDPHFWLFAGVVLAVASVLGSIVVRGRRSNRAISAGART